MRWCKAHAVTIEYSESGVSLIEFHRERGNFRHLVKNVPKGLCQKVTLSLEQVNKLPRHLRFHDIRIKQVGDEWCFFIGNEKIK